MNPITDEYDWDFSHMEEPPACDLVSMNEGATISEQSIFESLFTCGGLSVSDRTRFLEMLADKVRSELNFLISVHFRSNPRTDLNSVYVELRKQALRAVLPKNPNSVYYYEVYREVVSIIQKKTASDRKKRQGKLCSGPPRKSYSDIKIAKKNASDEAEDILEHGFHTQGEFYLSGIPRRDATPQRCGGGRGWIGRRAVRERIPSNERLGSILDEVDREISSLESVCVERESGES